MRRNSNKAQEKKTKNAATPEKPTPTFLKEDYPYPAIGEAITDPGQIASDALYEIKCPNCQMAVRSRGKTIWETYRRLTEGPGCFGCRNKSLILKKVDMETSKA